MTDENTRLPSDSVVEALRFWNEQSLAWLSTRYDHAKPGWMEVAIAKGTDALQALAAQPRDDVRRLGKVHTIRAQDLGVEGNARKDLEYIDGLSAHMDEDGKVSGKNVADLIAMVRWNAENLIEALSQGDEQPAIPDMTDAECATAYRDLRKRANDAGFATVGEWIDEQPDTDGLAVFDEDDLIEEIAEAISETFDVEWTAHDGARNVVGLLELKGLIALAEGDQR